jgi:hypothetical protein
MAGDEQPAGPTPEDNVADTFWLLFAYLVILGMMKVFAPMLPAVAAPAQPVDLSPIERDLKVVADLENASLGLPEGGAAVHPGKHADGLTAGSARRLVVVLDGRAVMEPYWDRAVGLVQGQLLGSPSAERVDVIVLGAPADRLPKPLTRARPAEPFDPLAVGEWCGQLKRQFPKAADLDPSAELDQRLASAPLDAGTRVVALLRDHGAAGRKEMTRRDVPIQFVLFGPPAGGVLGPWVLRSARASGGSASFLP